MHTKILSLILSMFECTAQLDILYKKAFGDILIDYSYTEMHTIDYIGKTQNPNVTKIAQALGLTKAAISKIIKKLVSKGAVETYKNETNKKEIYYKLTNIGQEVFEKHLKMHEIWCSKDEAFFKQFDDKDLKVVFGVLNKYSDLLRVRLKNIKEDLK